MASQTSWVRLYNDRRYTKTGYLDDGTLNEIVRRLCKQVEPFIIVYNNPKAIVRFMLSELDQKGRVKNDIVEASFQYVWHTVAQTYQEMIHMIDVTVFLQDGLGIAVSVEQNEAFYRELYDHINSDPRIQYAQKVSADQGVLFTALNEALYAGIRAELIAHIVDPRLVYPPYLETYEGPLSMKEQICLAHDVNIAPVINGVITRYLEDMQSTQGYPPKESQQALVASLRTYICQKDRMFESGARDVIRHSAGDHDLDHWVLILTDFITCSEFLDNPMKLTPQAIELVRHP